MDGSLQGQLTAFDLRKAFDTVDRILFSHIGGAFVKLLKEMYENNQMFVKLSSGLTQPFNTTLGMKQGCVLSPLIFNLFINDLPEHFDDQCDPLTLGDRKVQALMFADDAQTLT